MTGNGKVALVGAGPGDAGLLTLRGAELLRKADCVIYDRLINHDFLDMTSDSCEKIYVGKENHHHIMKQDSINQLLYDKSLEYKLVVRLKGGDPYVFGRGGEEALFLQERNVEVEVVPGISSSVAAAALSGIPVTHRGLSKGFMVITAHDRKDGISAIDYSKLTDEDITLVFLMGLSHVGEIAQGLMKAGRLPTTGAAVISCGTTPHQKKCVGTLENIEKLQKESNLPSPAVIVVGNVVSLSETLSFFEKRPLFGRKIFLPVIKKFDYSLDGKSECSRNELSKMLTEKGADVVSVVAGRIKPVKYDMDFLYSAGDEDYMVFTSQSGVHAFFYNLLEVEKRDLRSLPKCRYAVIGDKTARALLKFGVRADIVSEKATAAVFAKNLSGKATDGATIYWLCGKNHSSDLAENIGTNIKIKHIVCYENVPETSRLSEDEMARIRNCSAAIFTCGSNARFALRELETLPGKVFSIGPACSRVLRDMGVTDIKEAGEPSYEGITSLVVEDFSCDNL